MSGKAIFWGIIMLSGIWLKLWKKELDLVGTIVVIVGGGFLLMERRKEKKDKF